MTPVSEIKLIRTDTTLDLSQKAEKVCSRRNRLEVLSGVDRVGFMGNGIESDCIG